MLMIGTHDDRFLKLKFLHSALEELNEKEDLTVTDYLALRAFVLAEKQETRQFIEQEHGGEGELSEDILSYKELLNDVAAQLSNPASTNGDLKALIYDAHTSSANAYSHWLAVDR